eukprot:ctg_1127.g229
MVPLQHRLPAHRATVLYAFPSWTADGASPRALSVEPSTPSPSGAVAAAAAAAMAVGSVVSPRRPRAPWRWDPAIAMAFSLDKRNSARNGTAATDHSWTPPVMSHVELAQLLGQAIGAVAVASTTGTEAATTPLSYLREAVSCVQDGKAYAADVYDLLRHRGHLYRCVHEQLEAAHRALLLVLWLVLEGPIGCLAEAILNGMEEYCAALAEHWQTTSAKATDSIECGGEAPAAVLAKLAAYLAGKLHFHGTYTAFESNYALDRFLRRYQLEQADARCGGGFVGGAASVAGCAFGAGDAALGRVAHNTPRRIFDVCQRAHHARVVDGAGCRQPVRYAAVLSEPTASGVGDARHRTAALAAADGIAAHSQRTRGGAARAVRAFAGAVHPGYRGWVGHRPANGAVPAADPGAGGQFHRVALPAHHGATPQTTGNWRVDLPPPTPTPTTRSAATRSTAADTRCTTGRERAPRAAAAQRWRLPARRKTPNSLRAGDRHPRSSTPSQCAARDDCSHRERRAGEQRHRFVLSDTPAQSADSTTNPHTPSHTDAVPDTAWPWPHHCEQS